MNLTENFFLYFDTYKFFTNLMIYELIATDVDVKSCEAKCENKGGILPQDFGMLTVDDIYISGTTTSANLCRSVHLAGGPSSLKIIGGL